MQRLQRGNTYGLTLKVKYLEYFAKIQSIPRSTWHILHILNSPKGPPKELIKFYIIQSNDICGLRLCSTILSTKG